MTPDTPTPLHERLEELAKALTVHGYSTPGPLLREAAAELRQLAEVKAVLAEPNAVRLNTLRGTIAWTPETLRHALGDDAQELAEVRRRAQHLADALTQCREDSVELLGERGWWKDEPRCGYAERYEETAENIRKADEALAEFGEVGE